MFTIVETRYSPQPLVKPSATAGLIPKQPNRMGMPISPTHGANTQIHASITKPALQKLTARPITGWMIRELYT
ncbi:hypothetical protein ES705_29321 [subsurface metagenome]